MAKKIQDNNTLLTEILHRLSEAKAVNITLIDLRDIENTVCDYFIVASGNSSTHTASIASRMEKEVFEKTKTHPLSIEGQENKQWLLLDYGDIVVHVFQQEQRDYYRLEELWSDAKQTLIA